LGFLSFFGVFGFGVLGFDFWISGFVFFNFMIIFLKWGFDLFGSDFRFVV
jgi:hypothetical protein